MKNFSGKTGFNICVLFITLCKAQQRCNNGIECIRLDECKGLYQQLRNGTNPQLTRLLQNLHCGFEGESPKICCPPEFKYEDISQTRATFLPSSSVSSSSSSSSSGSSSSSSSSSSRSNSVLPSNRVCGIQNNNRIVGGTQADIDEHPWMALLRYDKPRGWGFYCGGVLIASRFVLTAAHCVKGIDLPADWNLSQVRLGEYNTTSEVDCLKDDCSGPVQDIPVEQIIAHNLYNPSDKNQHNDIALLKLTYGALFNDFVKPICLPLTNELQQRNFEGEYMEVAGWGKTETRSESDVKLKVRVPVVNTGECANVYQRVSRDIIDKQMCAGGDSGKDSCRGDSGGALMGQKSSANWMVVGVVSYGPSPCGTPGWPGVYTRVGAYMNWILFNMQA